MLKYLLFGEMAEWFKAPVLKTGVGQLTVGSNPSLSAEKECRKIYPALSFFYYISSRKFYALQLNQNASQGKRSVAPVPLGAGSLPIHIPSRAGTVGLAAPPPALQLIFQLFRISDPHLIH